MRLIDADALLNRMQEDPLYDLVEIYGVIGVINAEPTVDAIPVIRCKDCKYQLTNFDEEECPIYTGSYKMDDMFYCPYSERREES